MRKRSVLLALILSVMTFGLYFVYWFCSLTNTSNELAPKHATFGGFMALIMVIFTGSIYFFYWTFRLGQKAGEMNDTNSEGGLYFVLAFFTFGFIPMCLGQSACNKAITRLNSTPV